MAATTTRSNAPAEACQPRTSLGVLFILTLISALGGCQGLPQIDPTGQRIFLPYPQNSTRIELGELLHCNIANNPPSPFTGPAFVTPNAPPPCLQAATIGGPQVPVGTGPAFPCFDDCASGPPAVLVGDRTKLRDLLHLPEKGERGRMMLSPRRVIAPVGGEVILLAGICGSDGFLVTGEPIEWMLAPNSVGNIIQLGDDDRCVLYRLASSKRSGTGKVDNEFARGRTSTKPALITRGTRSIADDLSLKKGETWVSLSSPSEGVSYVTALAPESDCWDHRKATTTIYWIDATWTIPPPQTLPAGQPARLVTKVMRSEGTIPAEGWIVRYEILTPTLAGFAPDGRSVIEIPVNDHGESPVTVLPVPSTSGVAHIEVQVIRPARDDMPRMTLTRGETSITWAASGLRLRAAGPALAGFDQPVTIFANVANPGDLATQDVTVEVQLPPGVTFVSSAIPNENTPSRVLWRVGSLPPRTQFDIDLTVKSRTPFRAVFTARGSNVPPADAVVQVDVFQPSINLRVTALEDRVTVGDAVSFNIDVENIGDRPLTNLNLQTDGGRGMTHAELGRPVANKPREGGPLLPGETWKAAVTYNVIEPGEQCLRVIATSDGSQQANGSACVLAVSAPLPTPSITARITGDPQVSIADTTIVNMIAGNNGRVPLTNVRIVATYDPRVLPINGSPGVDTSAMSRSQLSWTIANIPPGSEATVSAQLRVDGPIGESNWIMTTDSDQGAQARTDFRFNVLPARPAPPTSQPPPVLPPIEPTPNVPADTLPPTPSPVLPNNTSPSDVVPPTDNRAGTGALRVQLTDLRTTAIVNENIPYVMTIQNDRSIADDGVRIRIRYNTGMQFIGLRRTTSGALEIPEFPLTGVIDLPVINYLRPGEKITYELTFQSNIPQLAELRVEASSRLSSNTITAVETTEVRAR